MSSIIEFFVAPDDTAAVDVAENGPGGSFESATYGNFDVWSTLVEWESVLTGRNYQRRTERRCRQRRLSCCSGHAA